MTSKTKSPADTKAAEAAAQEEAPEITNADVAKAINAEVRVPVTKKVKDEDTGKMVERREVIKRQAKADDIIGFRVDGDTVHATTCDGKKHSGKL